MSAFMDNAMSDLDEIFFSDEIGEIHNIDGNDTTVIIDNEELEKIKRLSDEKDTGIYRDDILLYVREKDISRKLKIGTVLEFDEKTMFVHSVFKNGGMYKLIVGANKV